MVGCTALDKARMWLLTSLSQREEKIVNDVCASFISSLGEMGKKLDHIRVCGNLITRGLKGTMSCKGITCMLVIESSG